jgi:hypothetical protein
MNFDFITDNMAVGTYPETAGDVLTLKDAGITHVLNVREIDDLIIVKDAFPYCWNPTADWNPNEPFGKEPKPVEWFANSLDFWYPPGVGWFTDERPHYRLYCHCSAGVNRSATTAWMFLRALQLRALDCDLLIDSHRLIATFGTIFDHPWRQNAEDALRTLGYIS